MSPEQATDTTAQIHTEADRDRIQKRTLAVVSLSQVLGGAGLAAGITVGALLAQDLLGSDSLAGLPIAIFTLGSALAAWLVGAFTQRWGRRIGLGLGFFVATIGALGVIGAAVIENIPLFFLTLFLYGAGTASNMQARYAGTDLARVHERGRAISMAMVWTTIGAVAGPNLVTPLGKIAESMNMPPLTGPFMLAAVAYGSAGIVLFWMMKPDPLFVARELEVPHTEVTSDATTRAPLARGVYVGATVMVLTQIAMIAIMTMTPVHMRAHDHEIGAIGLVIGIHIGAMYLPSLITGQLVDRLGRNVMAVASGVTLLISGVLAAMTSGDSLPLLILALALLGLGWNFGLISGTTLIVDATSIDVRPKIQGAVDVMIALAGAGAGAFSGVVVSSFSYETLAFGGGILSLLLIPVLYLAREGRKASPNRQASIV